MCQRLALQHLPSSGAKRAETDSGPINIAPAYTASSQPLLSVSQHHFRFAGGHGPASHE